MRSIRDQLLIYLVPGVLLLAAGTGLGLYLYMAEELEHGLDAALAAKAQAIAGGVHMEDDGQPHLLLPAGEASASTRHEGRFYFQLWRADGRTLARVAPPDCGDAALPGRENPTHRFSDHRLPDGTPARLTLLAFTAQPDEDVYDPAPRARVPPGEHLTLVVAHDRRSIDEPLAVLLSGLSLAGLVLAGGMVFVVTWGVRRSLAPLAEVARVADAVGPDSMDVRLPAGDRLPAELQPIGNKLNDLLGRLAAGFARERRFSAAVAHELRTPLAELRTSCEVALRWPDDADASRAALSDAFNISKEMGGLVQNLLALARGQAGHPCAPEDVPLATAVGAIAAKWAAAAHRRQLTLQITLDDSDRVWVDPALFSAVLRNLLDNAVEHSTRGGRVRVWSIRNDQRISLHLGNTCELIDPADVAHLTEPFWRKSIARTGSDHVGLGLSIVQSYCRSMNVPLEISAKTEWFEATLLLPASESNGTRTAPPLDQTAMDSAR